MVLAAMLGSDRRHAELILVNLTAATALFSLLQLSQTLPFLYRFSKPSYIEALNCMALSLPLAFATLFLVLERYESRRDEKPGARTFLVFGAFACFGVAALSLIAALWSDDHNPTYAFSISVVLFLSLMFLRRTNLDRWLKFLIAAIIGLTALVAFAQSIPRLQLLLGMNANGDDTDPIKRMLIEAPFFGVGAGTIPAFYAILGGGPAGDLAFSQLTAAEIVLIELGPAMATMIFLAVLTGFLYLIRCTFLRGRDAFFAALGASAFLGMVLIALSNAQLFGESFSTFAAALYGLAFIQSRGRAIT